MEMITPIRKIADAQSLVQPLDCEFAVQHVCRADALLQGEWVEFLARPVNRWRHLSTMEFIEKGYKVRGLLFDEDIVKTCLSLVAQIPERTWFSINIHPGSLQREHFGSFLRAELEQNRIDPARVILELVEFGGAVNMMASRAVIEDLRSAGMRFALDDFGRGYSNLDLIASGVLDFLKLDRSLIQFIDMDPSYVHLLRGLKAMADHTGLTVVAEGIETSQQAAIIRELGIPWIQGYRYSKPRKL